MDKNQMSIGHNGKLVMKATKCDKTGLWLIPLSKDYASPVQETGEVAANVFQTSTRSEWIQYLHQACFSPVPSTWKKAIDNDHFMSWPGLTTKAVDKYLPQTTATIKGHLARNCKKPKPTKEKVIELVGNMEEMDADMHPAEEVDAPCDLFVGGWSNHWRE
jgi:hypothetical protein